MVGQPMSKLRRSSELDITGGRTSRLLNICRKLGADEYYTGAAAKNYFDLKLFDEAGINVEFQNYRHPVYPQLFGDFIPYMSVVDLIFNMGDNAAEIIASGMKQ